RRLSFGLALTLPHAALAHAGEPQTVPPAEEAELYKNERATARPAKERPATTEKFAREGCLSNPEKCKCQSNDPTRSHFCGTMLGHFCPDSTLRYLAAACMDLFGGA